ncbi:MAG: tyrosine-type recombinase/integrase, partial [Myxococcota bacterium]
EYLRHARGIIGEYARYCDSGEPTHPRELRHGYLDSRTGRYGLVLTHRAEIVTRRLHLWLEERGELAPGSAAPRDCVVQRREPADLLQHFLAKVDPQLPQGLREPLNAYLEELICERELVNNSVKSILRTTLSLCRHLVDTGHDSFAGLRVAQLDALVSSLVDAPRDDLLARRTQVRTHHSRLRGFLRFVYHRGILDRDVARGLISPPCYRASTPPTVLSEYQVEHVLGSVDRSDARGRRCYAILVSMTTYGLRPVDVSRLRLDDLHWREQRLSLVQQKTGRVLSLPLVPELTSALHDYLRQDHVVGLDHRRVFVSLDWPHRPVRAATISAVVAGALREAGLPWARAKHLRATVATHLLRQGEALSTIQEVLGHRTAETTQRYALADVEMLRRVLEESER